MKWLNWSGGKKSTTLSSLVADYIPFVAPHCGDHNGYSDEQAAENLSYFLEHKQDRLNQLCKLLTPFSINLHKTLRKGDYRPLVKSLYQWSRDHWPTAIKHELATREVWRNSNRQGDQILYSVALDVGIILGEIIINRKPSYSWGLDLDRQNIDDQMPTARRIVLLAASQIHSDKTVLIDCEVVSASIIFNTSPTYSVMNVWLNVVNDAVSGLTEGAWATEKSSDI